MKSVSRYSRRAPRVSSRPLTAALAGALLASVASAQVTPLVDYYQTNTNSNLTAQNNAVVNLLNGFGQLWTTGATWDTGSPTALGAPILAQNLAYVAQVTQARTAQQETFAYLIDRRHQSYSAIGGLGDLAAGFRAGSGAFTTIADTIPTAALTGKFDEKGNGAGSTSSALGKVVTLVNTLRGNNTSTNPPKAAFLYPRPWRLNADNQVVPLGTETTGYFTSTLADGTPNTSGTVTYFPLYQTDAVIAPSLLAVRSTTPATDGGYPSGHANASFLASYALAFALPERYSEIMLHASEMGESRILAGMHSPLDVMGGRLQATGLAAAILYKTENATLKADARAQAQGYFATELAAATPPTQAEWEAGKALYTQRMTYGLSPVGDTTLAASVPKGAEALIESRFAYLDESQRREVLRTTAIASGQAGEDAEGWSRLNLYSASGGYGSFASDVTVMMNAANGGLHAKDYWRNNISGTGGFTKLGTGTLVFTGDNTYTGATLVGAGTLAVEGRLDSDVTVASGATLGGSGQFDGSVLLQSGAILAPGSSPGTITFNDGLTILAGTIMNFELGTFSDQVLIAGGALVGPSGNGGITLNLLAATGFGAGTYTLFDFSNASGVSDFGAGDFAFGSSIAGYDYQLNEIGNTVQLTVSAIPEPSTYAAILGLATLGFTAWRRRRRV